MDQIQGTNNSLAHAKIAAQYLEDANDLSTAQAGLVLDALKDEGSQLVALIEGLGETSMSTSDECGSEPTLLRW